MIYECCVTAGTGSATSGLTPLIQAWGAAERISLFPGTLNLCADQHVQLPSSFIALGIYARFLPDEVAFRRGQPGFDPRLYPVVLNGRHKAWLFRWSDEAYRTCFVGDSERCLSSRACEIVASSKLRVALGLVDGSRVRLSFADSTGSSSPATYPGDVGRPPL